ncbi:uncharacterized protein M437DRAFT_80944 [Aureobasidium melanogenum CBS 110374]|uniref:Uncharacterized protein n=1 Tax=Aureobasidium melanogenum (strain CBS 110374) TaxID=1043003 RepID=A0A074W047_AURM1|nr:uncharacterized protein M437DRAFT_80944 [Aureobasidium melanogenum CBS 110374]KEQ66455.1 hypothetical protein M437DRAFT_80944 [Aureobasidium melanogenum CBS 110374]
MDYLVAFARSRLHDKPIDTTIMGSGHKEGGNSDSARHRTARRKERVTTELLPIEEKTQKRRCIFLMRLQPPSIHVNINEEQKREINEQEQSEKQKQGHEALNIHRRHQPTHPTPSPPRN